jgi:hypothetical protein
MSSVQEPHLHLEVGHSLFLDIVGYSKLLADDQKELVQELNQIVRETEQFRAAEAEGKLTRLPTGDGMVLVFTNNPLPRADSWVCSDIASFLIAGRQNDAAA